MGCGWGLGVKKISYSSITRSDSIQLTTFFCLTKYELVRTTKFTRLVLPLFYVKRFVVVN